MLEKTKFLRLKVGRLSKAGRNIKGNIIVRHKSIGHKKSMFKIDTVRR